MKNLDIRGNIKQGWVSDYGSLDDAIEGEIKGIVA